MNGLRLAGIEGTVAAARRLRNALEWQPSSPTSRAARDRENRRDLHGHAGQCPRCRWAAAHHGASTGGGAAGKDRLTRYIREAIGVKI